MARYENKSFHQQKGLYGLIQLFGKLTLTGNATPANTVVAISGPGFASASRTGTGQFSVILDHEYTELHNAQLTLEATATLTTGEHVKLDSYTLSTGTFVIETTDPDGAPEDLTADEVATIHIHLALAD